MICVYGSTSRDRELAGTSPEATDEVAILKSDDWLAMTLAYVVAEAGTEGPGNAAALSRLVELLLLEILRRHVRGLDPGRSSWLAGVRDPIVGPALRMLHDHPERRWTVAELGREVGASRSVLAHRFVRLVGQPPMRYQALWRIQTAKRLLVEAGLSIPEVASRVGYDSEAAFNRAFRRHVGLPPGSWRAARRRQMRGSVPATSAG
jgi:AraC-like DNA-binding protein